VASPPLFSLGSGLDCAHVREFGTKIAALLQLVTYAATRGEKVVVFSAWTRLLALASAALTSQHIGCASLVGSPASKHKALERFRAIASDRAGESGGTKGSDAADKGSAEGGPQTDDCVALFVPLYGGSSGAGGSGAAGLNLQVASVAVLLEPSLQPGIEQQAVGRICRIGQDKPAKCIRLVVKDSIEPNILQWQGRRLAQGSGTASGLGPALSLNEFVHVLGQRRGGRASAS